MAHDILIILTKSYQLKGNATNGLAFDFHNCILDAQNWFISQEDQSELRETIHHELEKVQDWFAGGCALNIEESMDVLNSWK